MLTLPAIVERPSQPYVAIRERVTIPFGPVVDRVMPELFATLKARGIAPAGPVFFKYNLVAMPDLEMEFGVPVATAVGAAGRLVAGMLPGGRYAQLTYWGHYDHLMDANAVLIGWAKEVGLVWDSVATADGERFASRFEMYPNSPDEEPDPSKWETTVAIKLRD